MRERSKIEREYHGEELRSVPLRKLSELNKEAANKMSWVLEFRGASRAKVNVRVLFSSIRAQFE
jgi:hypothetical protein